MSNDNNTKAGDANAFNLLGELFDVLNIKKINIYQIDFLIMYFPFYLMIKEITDKRNIELAFDHSNNDDDSIVRKILKGEIKTLKYDDQGNGILNLAVCEPVTFNDRGNSEFDREIIKDKNTIYSRVSFKPTRNYHASRQYEAVCISHAPFISFPPLFAIACANNPKINIIKKKYLEDNRRKLNRNDYWRHFSSNFSLLQKEHFKELSASLYPKKTTTDWMIRHHRSPQMIELKSKSWVKSISGEFDDVLKQHVDVAFTVQPWMAVEKSKKQNCDIEIVYKSNVVHDYCCTSILFFASVYEKENMIIGNYMLGLMSEILDDKIKELLIADRDKLEEWISSSYCEMLSNSCEQSKKSCHNHDCSCCTCDKSNTSNSTESTQCTELNEIALEILADMNIYKVNVNNFGNENTNKDLRYIQASYFYNKVESMMHCIDRLNYISDITTALAGNENRLDALDSTIISKSLLKYDSEYINVINDSIWSGIDISVSALIASKVGPGSNFYKLNHLYLDKDQISSISNSVLKEVDTVSSLCLIYNKKLEYDKDKLLCADYVSRTKYRKNIFTTRKENDETSGLKSNIDCIINKINKECGTIISCSNFDELYIPSILIKEFIQPVIRESQEYGRASKYISLCSYQLKCDRIEEGVYKSLHFIALKMDDSNWDFSKSKLPNPFKDNNKVKYKLFFDYIIIASNANSYKLIESNTLTKNSPEWIEMIDKISLNIRQTYEVEFVRNANNITLSYNTKSISIPIDPKSTYHLFVFDNVL